MTMGRPVPTFEQIKDEYTLLLSMMAVRSPAWAKAIDKAARYIIKNRIIYEHAGEHLGVPWYWVGAIHWREASGSFAGVLHNGEHIIGKGVKTRLEPKGRGPFESWEEAADDALRLKGLDPDIVWTPEQECYRTEAFNGWGYYQFRNHLSPYLWSGTNHYTRGKYVSDGGDGYRPDVVDQQVGVIPVTARIKSLLADEEARQFVAVNSTKAQALGSVKSTAQGVAAAAAGVFTLDNLGLFQGWMGLFSGLGKFAAVAGICVLGYWVLSNWLLRKMAEDVKKGRYTPSGAEGKATEGAPDGMVEGLSE